MSENVYETTEKAKRKGNAVIPFEKLKPGTSSFLAVSAVREDSLRSLVSKANAINEFGFKVVKHKQEGFFEIACFDKSAEHSFNIVTSSPQAITSRNVVLNGKRKYPFAELLHGFSFTVPYSEQVERSLRVACSVNSKKLRRQFSCIKHDNLNLLEVACCNYKTAEFVKSSPEANAYFNKE